MLNEQFHTKNMSVFIASNIVFMSTKAVLVDFGLSVQMTEDIYFPKDLRGTEVIILSTQKQPVAYYM